MAVDEGDDFPAASSLLEEAPVDELGEAFAAAAPAAVVAAETPMEGETSE